MTTDTFAARVADRVLALMNGPVIPIEASGRHIHLSRAAIDTLFGAGYQLTKVSELSQPGEFVSAERLRVVGPKGELASVVVLGPERRETQMEISLTDAVSIGLKVPVRLSGHTAGTPGVRLIGPNGELTITEGVIAAERHIHMTPEYAAEWGFTDGEALSVRVFGDRPLTFHGVIARISPKFATYMHIDYDEANACRFQKGMCGFILQKSTTEVM